LARSQDWVDTALQRHAKPFYDLSSWAKRPHGFSAASLAAGGCGSRRICGFQGAGKLADAGHGSPILRLRRAKAAHLRSGWQVVGNRPRMRTWRFTLSVPA